MCCTKLRGHGEAVLSFALSIPFSAMVALPQLGKIDAFSVKDNGIAAVESFVMILPSTMVALMPTSRLEFYANDGVRHYQCF